MRALALAAALVLALAAPAAAQPDPAQILIGALEQAARNLPDRVADFTMTVSEDDGRTELYVWREGDEILTTVDDEMVTSSMLLWPDLAALHHDGMNARDENVAGVEYMRADTVEGRPVHVLLTPGLDLGWGEEDRPDSVLVFVDAETRQVLRLAISDEQRPTGERLNERGGRSEMTITFGDYRETDGVTAPRRMRVWMRMRLNLDDADRRALREEGAAAVAEAEAAGEAARNEVRYLRRMISLYQGEPVVTESVIHEVRVNSGRPEWVTF
jgi:hypothetical protein